MVIVSKQTNDGMMCTGSFFYTTVTYYGTLTAVPPPKFLLTSSLTGTAPWHVGCIAIPDGPYQVTWSVIGGARILSGDGPTDTYVAAFWFKDKGNNTITLTITNLQNNSDEPFTRSFPVTVTENASEHITGFTMRPAAIPAQNYSAMQFGSAMGFSLTTDLFLPCIKWDYDINSDNPSDHECTREQNPNHTYQTAKVITGQVTLHTVTGGPCSCEGNSMGLKDFSLLVYDPSLFPKV